MSFTDTSKNRAETSIESDNGSQNYNQGDSDESVSESINKLKIISHEKSHKHIGTRKNFTKNQRGRLNTSLRYAKHGRHCMKRNRSRKFKEKKTSKRNSVKNLENKAEANTIFTQKGKRCRLGGKAKGKPPEEENCDKGDSDEETDNSYFSRISLGYFQKFRDKSGASTSHQLGENYKNPSFFLKRTEELLDKTEEMELLELQQWGMVNLICSKGVMKSNAAEDISPDKI